MWAGERVWNSLVGSNIGDGGGMKSFEDASLGTS